MLLEEILAQVEAQAHQGPQLNDSRTHYERNHLADKGCAALIAMLNTPSDFESIKTNNGQSENFSDLLQAISTNGKIKYLDISGFILSGNLIDTFNSFIKKASSLLTLTIDATSACQQQNEYRYRSCPEMNETPCEPTLKEQAKIVELQKTGHNTWYLYKAKTEARGHDMINALAQSSLTELTFHLNPADSAHLNKTFNHESRHALCTFINMNTKCEHLGFANIEINNATIWSSVLESLKNNRTIKRLSFKHCQINEEIVTTLASVLQGNNVIEEIDFEQKDMSPEVNKAMSAINDLLAQRRQAHISPPRPPFG